ncbi:MAG: hypothetical protein DMD92_00060, partial [Candidatus Rokuibacteriota bacterium]
MGIGQLREGEHASLFYDRPAELLESLVPAVRQALASGEQCIYLADEITAAHVASALGPTVDVREALDRRALRLVTQRVSFCPTGKFRTGEMAAFLERSVTDGLADGFPGVVVAEDVAWALGPEARLDEVAGHEELVESLVAVHPVTAICQYAAPHVPPSVAHMVLGLHPVVRIPLTDATDVGAVRQRGRAIAEPLGFAPGDLTLMWTVISELVRNVVERGLRGELILRRLEREHRLGMCVTVRVEEAGLTPTALLPVLPEVGPLMDECEVLSGADRGVIMSITKWVRDHHSAREAPLVVPSWKRETDAARGSDVRPQREELIDFFDNAPVPLHWLAEDGRILWANRAELELLGYTSEEYIGRNTAEFHEDADAIADILRRLSRNETVNNY